MFNVYIDRFVRKYIRTRRRRVVLSGVAMLLALLWISTLGFWFLERERELSLFDSLWLSYVTMTTVGYGDLYPTSAGGRILAAFVTMTGGIGVVAYIATLFATTILEGNQQRVRGLARVKATNHILIVNCPNVEKVITLIDELRLEKHAEETPVVLITDDVEECPQPLLEIEDFYFVKGNPLLARVLEQANAVEAARAVVLAKDATDANSDGITTQIALVLENMHRLSGKDMYTVAEAVSKDSIVPLHAAGVEHVVCFETIIPPILAQATLNPKATRAGAVLATSREGSQFYVGNITHLQGRLYHEIRELFKTRDELRIVPIGLYRESKPLVNPSGDTEIEEGDELVYIAEKSKNLPTGLAVKDGELTWTA